MRVIRRISAVIVGFVFFLAGLLKLMDPVGAGLVVDEYFKFFHCNFLLPLSYLTGVGAAFLETFLGAALITGVWRRITDIVTMALLGFYTLVTLLLLIYNPDMDCGCFGEIIHLTHLQSFLKNLALVALCLIAFLPLNKQEPTRKVKYVSFPIACVSACLFFLYSALSIPLVDFTQFKPGAELLLPDEIDDPADTRTPTISFCDADGEYADSLIMGDKLILVTIYEPDKVSARSWQKISSLLSNASGQGYTTLTLVSSTPEAMEGLVSSPEILSNVYFGDRKNLLTVNRSNGGATFIADGQIISKWGVLRLPENDKLRELYETNTTESLLSENNGAHLKFQGFLLYVFAVMLLL